MNGEDIPLAEFVASPEILLLLGGYALLISLVALTLCLVILRCKPRLLGFGKLGFLLLIPSIVLLAGGWPVDSISSLFILCTGCALCGSALFCFSCLLSAPWGKDVTAGNYSHFKNSKTELWKSMRGKQFGHSRQPIRVPSVQQDQENPT